MRKLKIAVVLLVLLTIGFFLYRLISLNYTKIVFALKRMPCSEVESHVSRVNNTVGKYVGVTHDTFINGNSIFVRKTGGEYEVVTKYSVDGKMLSTCKNSFFNSLDGIVEQNPSCRIPPGSMTTDNYLEYIKTRCVK